MKHQRSSEQHHIKLRSFAGGVVYEAFDILMLGNGYKLSTAMPMLWYRGAENVISEEGD